MSETVRFVKPQVAIELLKPLVTPWRTIKGDTFCDINGTSYNTGSRSFKLVLMSTLIEVGKGAFCSPIHQGAVASYFESLASRSKVYKDNIRTAALGEDIWIDTSGNGYVHLTKTGWALGDLPPDIKFMPGGGMHPIRVPDKDTKHGSLVDELRPFVPVEKDADLHLIAGWLVGAMRPDGPYPILMLHGEQGSAKSTTTRLLRRIVDPHERDMREPPTTDRDFVAAARNSYVLAFDNMSYIKPTFSDTLCRIATGTGAIGGRRLYSDDDDASFTACRPIVLNGIPDTNEREDLADRAITLSLPRIEAADRVDDASFWSKFDVALPRILAALYSTTVCAMRRVAEVTPSNLPRMSQFARWVYASYPDEVGGEQFLRWYDENRGEARNFMVETDPFLQGMISFMQDLKGQTFEGSIYELTNRLSRHFPQGFEGAMPKTPRGLAERLKRAAPLIRKAGIDMHKGGRDAKGRRRLQLVWNADAQDRGFSVSVAA